MSKDGSNLMSVEAHRRLHLEYLPPYQPGLNVQERIWRQVRYEATTNIWFQTLDETWIRIQRTTRSWSPNKIKRLCKIT
jgi:transposase